MFKFSQEVCESIIGRTEQVEKSLKGAIVKFDMYMGQKVRAKIQDDRIKEMFQLVKEREDENRVIFFIDYKIKVEPERHIETQLQYYGK